MFTPSRVSPSLCLGALAGLALLAACRQEPPSVTQNSAAPASASAALAATEGRSAAGTLTFSRAPGGIAIQGELSGLTPGAQHGFHIHEKGDCSAADASSAGGHLNPDQQPHGRMSEGPHHAGDIPNAIADDSGHARIDVTLPGLELGTGSAHDVVGKAVVVHAGADDYQSQPAGNSGARIACGVISAD